MRVPGRSIAKVGVVVAFLAFAGAAAAAPRAVVQGLADPELRARAESAVGEADRPPLNRFQARRRAEEAAAVVEELLRSEGWYAARIETSVEDGPPPTPVVKVDPGQRFTVSGAGIDWGPPAPDAATAAAAESALELAAGAPARAADVIAAEGRVVAALHARGHADARAAGRRVVVDHAARTLSPTFFIDAGAPVPMDGVRIVTSGRTRGDWAASLAPWSPGERYEPTDLAEYERRLTETGAYDAVSVALAPVDAAESDGSRPVVVALTDRPRQVNEIGFGWSTTEGFGLDAQWTRYNRFRRADTLVAELRLAEIEQRLAAKLVLPHWRKPDRTLETGIALSSQQTEAYDRDSLGVRAEVRQKFDRTSFVAVGAALDVARNRELVLDTATLALTPVERDLAIGTVFAGLNLDRSDDPLDPRRGWRVQADAAPTVVAGDDGTAFTRVQAQATAYVPLGGERTVAAFRARTGTILGGDLPGVPADRRFYSGGGGSVRGYDYQGIGPRLSNGAPSGGLSLVEGSAEVRTRVRERWGVAAFVEAGTVGDHPTPSLDDVRWSAGVGVRYRLPFGPIRADVAFPLDDGPGASGPQIYISIGQAF